MRTGNRQVPHSPSAARAARSSQIVRCCTENCVRCCTQESFDGSEPPGEQPLCQCSPCRIDSGWRRIRRFTRIRDYFDARAHHEQSRQYIYHTSSPGKLQDTCCNAHGRVQRTSEAPNVPSSNASTAHSVQHALAPPPLPRSPRSRTASGSLCNRGQPSGEPLRTHPPGTWLGRPWFGQSTAASPAWNICARRLLTEFRRR